MAVVHVNAAAHCMASNVSDAWACCSAPRPHDLDRQPRETDHLEHQMAMRPDNPGSGFDSAEGDAEQEFGH